METKTRKLLIAIELVALVTAGLLILVDYKLKRDLLKLFERIESAIETGRRLYPENADISADTGRVPASTMVGDNPRMEKATHANPNNGNTSPRTNRRKSPVSSRGNGDTEIPQPSEPVGT